LNISAKTGPVKVAARQPSHGAGMTNTTQDHWEEAYRSKPAAAMSWFQAEPSPSLDMIAAAGPGPGAAIVDVGGGASTLVDRLLDQGFSRLSVLDVSSYAMAAARARLGARADSVDWLAQDITAWTPPAGAFDLWHDRAVFHFLVDDGDRRAYLRALNRGLRPGGHLILATFALTGPQRCSGLPVRRYTPSQLQALLGAGFRLLESRPQVHVTPAGGSQDFVWCHFVKTAEPAP
jgi:SAM-dependent methyltransferase